MLLGEGGYQEREKTTHIIKLSSFNYQAIKYAYHNIDDPEVQARLKDIALYKWQEETDEKYRYPDYYYDIIAIDEKLQLEHFEIDFYTKSR